MASLINKQNVKALAKEVGQKVHGKDNLQISADFFVQIEQLVKAVVTSNAIKQDNLAGTLRQTVWGKERLVLAKELLDG
tara:strand:- start:34 stop:270 length:237 start_codon:yes stop_codon:yes gene_type:complete